MELNKIIKIFRHATLILILAIISGCTVSYKFTGASISTTEGYLKYSSAYEFTLNANVSDVDGTFTYQWYKDGVAIAGATSSSYKTKQDAGTSKYTVVISDGKTSIGALIPFLNNSLDNKI